VRRVKKNIEDGNRHKKKKKKKKERERGKHASTLSHHQICITGKRKKAVQATQHSYRKLNRTKKGNMGCIT
jgi:hypothetical protein